MEFDKEVYLKAYERFHEHNMQVDARLKANKKHCNYCGWKSEGTDVYCPMCEKKKAKQ